MKDCIFCRIVSKENPADIVYEDSKVLAFLDIMPRNPGHTLVIPKVHSENIFEITEEEIGYLYRIVKKITMAVKKAMQTDGISIIQSNEKGGSQGIFHFHTHVIPRYSGDKLSKLGPIWESDVTAPKDELAEVSKKIKRFV